MMNRSEALNYWKCECKKDPCRPHYADYCHWCGVLKDGRPHPTVDETMEQIARRFVSQHAEKYLSKWSKHLPCKDAKLRHIYKKLMAQDYGKIWPVVGQDLEIRIDGADREDGMDHFFIFLPVRQKG